MTDTFDLSIFDSGDPARVIAVARTECDWAVETLPSTQLKDLSAFRRTLDAAAGGTGQRPSDIDLLNFGRALFAFTVRNSVDQIYRRLPGTHVRLHIYSDRADIQGLPWEYMQDPGTPPGPNSMRSVVRVIPTIGVDVPEPLDLGKGKLRVLFVYADPIDQDSVAWDDIRESIVRDFETWSPDGLEMDVVEGASPEALFKALASKRYDVLHFAGHGRIAANGTGELLFVNLTTRNSQPLSAAALGTLLRGRGLRLVVLSACSTSAGNFADEFAVVASTLVRSTVPAVVANQFPITNSVAAKFSGAFYDALLRTGDVDQATTSGRVLLFLEPALPGGAARIEWGIPTLYRHAGVPRILKV